MKVNYLPVLKTPVLFLVFNRIDTTELVFETIRNAKPPRLYIACDGARIEKENEVEEVKAVRDYVLKNIDWECSVKTLFREKNFGCKIAVNNAIDWFFENEEQGIILEDDCLPSQSFFWFCEEMLNYYKTDMRVFLISGFNKQNTWKKYSSSYFFSNLGGIWGWASWRDRWKYQNLDMPDLDAFNRNGNFERLLGRKLGKKRRNDIVNIQKSINQAWDYQWGYARHKNNGLSCVPVLSLVENIGFDERATHTKDYRGITVKRHDFSFPILHNQFFIPDRKYDELFVFGKKYSYRDKFKILVKRVIN
jgi:hypothetical protein